LCFSNVIARIDYILLGDPDIDLEMPLEMKIMSKELIILRDSLTGV
jgi:hypothetical protein